MTAGTVRLQEAGLSDDRSAFGHYALSPGRERLRRFAQELGHGGLARRACSVIRRIVGFGLAGPFDIEPFPGQRARLYPDQNLSDKRVFAGVQFWDQVERAALGKAVRDADEPVYMVDAGANAGLYTLAVRAEARGKALKVLAVEPDPENLKRLKFNIAASQAEADVVIAEVALGEAEGKAHITASHANRGELTIDEAGTPVAVRPLTAVLDWAGFPRIDALKIDIEGFELPVLRHFLANTPEACWPGIVIMEAHRGARTEALDLLLAHGYHVDAQTRMNAVMRRTGGTTSREHA
ncbi:MAG: FkbM family methyltransferase [Pseudomonadota bacterium]